MPDSRPLHEIRTGRRIFRTNRNAATLAFLTLLLLIPGLTLPFVQSTIVGEERTYSVITGIRQLFADDHPFLALIIFVFSVVFPIVKAVFLLVATSSFVPLGDQGRARIAHFAITTGKYSLLDLLVVALLIVIVKLDGIASVDAEIGTIFFGTSVLLAMLAGLCVHFPQRSSAKAPTSSARGGSEIVGPESTYDPANDTPKESTDDAG